MGEEERRDSHVTGKVWNMWSDYWVAQGKNIPALHFLRRGADQDFIFVTYATNAELDEFLTLYGNSIDLLVQKESDWWLPTNKWFGHWLVMRASIKRPFLGVERDVWGGEAVKSSTE